MGTSHTTETSYYLPDPSHWPLTGSISLFLVFAGAAMSLNGSGLGLPIMIIGALILIYMLFGWFGQVVGESVRGLYNQQVDISFRWSMSWFIFSEVMFFAAFFGVLFYTRVYSVPWLGGEGTGALTHSELWPAFQADWPPLAPPDTEAYKTTAAKLGALWVPMINTAILLSSGLTITMAHWALKKNKRRALSCWTFATFALGLIFVGMQAVEYHHAATDLNLTLNSGIYGAVFYMLTGFHGFHVSLGALMLIVIWFRCLKNHFTPENHFAFEAVAWYWHFVDVVWLLLFVLVYVL